MAQGRLDEAFESYRDNLAIAERLAFSDRSNAGWQLDLSVSYDKVGNVLVAQGKLDAALQSYRDSLAICEHLTASDRSNTGWQRDLSVSYDKVCSLLVVQGKLDEAIQSYRESLAIRERLTASDRSNTGWQRDLSVSYEQVGSVLVAIMRCVPIINGQSLIIGKRGAFRRTLDHAELPSRPSVLFGTPLRKARCWARQALIE